MKFVHNIQLYENDCGTACVTSLLKYYGYNVDYNKIKNEINNDELGTSIIDIKKFFIKYNFETKIFKINNNTNNDLIKISNQCLPCLVFIENDNINHYLVLYRILSNGKCIISDPSHAKVEKINVDYLVNVAKYIISINKDDKSNIPVNLLLNDKNSLLHTILRNYMNELFTLIIISFVLVLVNLFLSSSLGFYVDNILPNIKYINSLTICIFCIVYLLIAFGDTYLNFLKIEYVQNLTNKIEYYLYSKYISKVLTLNLKFINNISGGELLNRLKEGMNIIELISMILTRGVVDILLIIISIVPLIYISPILGILHIVMSCILIIIANFFFNKIYVNSHEVHKVYANLDDKLIKVITNLENELIHNKEIIDKNNIDGLLKKYLYKRNINFNNSKSLTTLQGIVLQITNFLILIIGLYLIESKKLSIGELIIFTSISSLLISSIIEIMSMQVDFENQIVSYKRFTAIMNINNTYKLINKLNIGKIRKISLKNYSLQYDKNQLIKDSNININHKNNIIIGKSGCGKSSLAKSIIGINDFYKGEIYVNDINIKYLNKTYLRDKIIYLSNTVSISNEKIIDYLTDGRKILSNKILKVCEDLNILDFINNLPGTFNYKINNDGSNLSLGQKQRLLIAYGLLKEPDVIIFDETFSNIDEYNKKIILQNLQNYNILMIYITHQSMELLNRKMFSINNNEIIEVM